MTLPATLAARARAFADEALSQNSRRAYRADWQHYTQWCRGHDLAPLPAGPEQVASYLTSMAETHKRATIERRLVTIGQAHKLQGLPWIPAHPAVRAALRGMFRRYGRPRKQAAALGVPETIRIVSVCEGTVAALRDRALFLMSFAGAFRRSEVARIRFEDLAFRDGAVDVFLPYSKGDQDGEGTIVSVLAGRTPASCPVAALRRWLQAAPADGHVFRAVRADGTVMDDGLHPDSVGRIVQKRAAEAGLVAGPRERISAHGFRAGFITEAYKRGSRDEEIMAHSRHRDLKTMRGYVRRAKLADAHPGRNLGL
ncbi:site-specific integrase [Methylobacterium sp. C33D]